jgi:hypothetical protein
MTVTQIITTEDNHKRRRNLYQQKISSLMATI